MGAGEQDKPISEQLKSFATPEEQPVTAELITEHASVQPGGHTRVGVLFTIKEGWHIYADPPGDAGLRTRITWSGSSPAGVSFGPLVWPKPQAFLDPGEIRTFGYAERVLLSSVLTIPAPPPNRRQYFPFGDVRITANAEWLACKEVCIPGSADLELVLPIQAETPKASPHAPQFNRG